MQTLTSLVQPGDVIADFGCGNGRLLKALPSVNFHYYGFDDNQQLLEQAKRNFPQHQFDFCRLPDMPNQSLQYDKVFLIAVFQHLVDQADRQLALRRIYQSLKPGGRLLMTNWRLWSWRYLPYMFKRLNKKIAWNDFFIPWNHTVWRYYHGFTQSELQRLLTQAGFIVEQQEIQGYNYLTVAIRPLE